MKKKCQRERWVIKTGNKEACHKKVLRFVIKKESEEEAKRPKDQRITGFASSKNVKLHP